MKEALCIGGPYDGRTLAGKEKRMQIPIAPPLNLSELVDPTETILSQSFDVFTYGLYRVNTEEFWLPEDVILKGHFDYCDYMSPLDFILKRLANGYNPRARQ